MPNRVSTESWIDRTEAIALSLRDDDSGLRGLPPLIIEFKGGEFTVAGGNHRLGAVESLGHEEAWTITWSNSEMDHRSAVEVLEGSA